jgi:hypothetical protein
MTQTLLEDLVDEHQEAATLPLNSWRAQLSADAFRRIEEAWIEEQSLIAGVLRGLEEECRNG